MKDIKDIYINPDQIISMWYVPERKSNIYCYRHNPADGIRGFIPGKDPEHENEAERIVINLPDEKSIIIGYCTQNDLEHFVNNILTQKCKIIRLANEFPNGVLLEQSNI